MKRLAWLFETGLFILLSIPLAMLPFRFSIKVGEILGLFLFYIWGSRRKIAIENIMLSAISPAPGGSAEADSQPSAINIAKETFKNLGKSFIEVIKIYYGLGEKIIDSVEIKGIENFNQAKAKGKGVLFITGHCGNWELMAIATSVKLSRVAGVARPFNNLYINRFIEKTRERYGNSVIYKKGALREIIQRLRQGGCVGILMDQAVLPNEGYTIDFIGRKAWTTKMPALIAMKTGAAVLPTFIHRTDKGHVMKIHPEVKLSEISDKEKAVVEDTKRFSGFIEDYIKAYPSEWLWIHRRWKRAG
ncbi:MAG: lysophospholipid acyltransferase family protein [Nitrospirae bacterium]|nr:lysophospholipid acyltransferase family protein [Nitrospirota bacterium]